jgi:anti-sigma regulatory factor (Ser/Thr protein kinase)
MSGRAAQQRIARLDTTPRAPSQARSLVTGALRSWSVPEATVSNVEIAVSELVSNAVEHGVGQIDLELDLAGARLLLRVRDGEASAPVRRTVDEQAVRGRGLLIVEALSTSWGHHADGDGKWVWAEFALPDEPPGEADPAE